MRRFYFVGRTKFVELRYQNFIKSKAWIESMPEKYQKHCILTDLDRVYKGETKQQRDIILCDRCNQDIDTTMFVMLEEQYCYHLDCIKPEMTAKEKANLGNVVPMAGVK